MIYEKTFVNRTDPRPVTWTAGSSSRSRTRSVGRSRIGILFQVDLRQQGEPQQLADGLGTPTTAAVRTVSGAFAPHGVPLDGTTGTVYATTWEGQLWRFSLHALQSRELIEIKTGA
ncbi:hypothetical protein GCM10018785_24410 [Streptomyces longispororuber]|uniref:Uncharacterized protein n=1 Tax=Streptomyces longispororuber TaxID=68230 RepID=A0A918ZHT4_9ACTN|nr:hypothetical protein [Streptomyces longispororuber]GHE54062.1 hypothetical protein GCM10018785_24410 [Streptomyces longispororuber]